MTQPTDTPFLKMLASKGEELIQERDAAQEAELEKQMQLFAIGVQNKDIPRSAVDALIEFLKNPTSTPASQNDSPPQLALGAGPSSQNADENLAQALHASSLSDGVKRAIRRLTVNKNDASHIAVDDYGTPVEIAELRKQNDGFSSKQLGLETEASNAKQAQTKAENERNAAKEELDRYKRQPHTETYAAAEKVNDFLKTAKPSGLGNLFGGNSSVIKDNDLNGARAALNELRDPEKVEATATKQLPKANH